MGTKEQFIEVGDEGYFNMPEELDYSIWSGTDEDYIEVIFKYILDNKMPSGSSLVAIEHKVGAPTEDEISENIEAVRKIVRRDWPEGEVGVAPFLFCLEVLRELTLHERKLGLKIDKKFFEQEGLISRVLLCGDILSSGIKMAVDWAGELGIPVGCDSEEMEQQLTDYRSERS